MGAPPVAVVYHRYSPGDPPEPLSVTEPAPQRPALVTVGPEGTEFIVAVTIVRELSQNPLLIET